MSYKFRTSIDVYKVRSLPVIIDIFGQHSCTFSGGKSAHVSYYVVTCGVVDYMYETVSLSYPVLIDP